METFIPTVFGLTAVLVVLAIYSLSSPRPGKERLERLKGKESRSRQISLADVADSARNVLTGALSRMAPRSAAKQDESTGLIRARLVHAGYRSPSAPTVYMGSRIALAVLAPLILLLVPSIWGLDEIRLVAALCGSAGVAFVLPSYWLDRQVRSRQDQIRRGLPDALDLMVVCVEAGLGLNASLARIAQEFRNGHPILSQEFALVSIEIRAGKATLNALRALGERTGVNEIRVFVSMLIQTERFGTSMADALRVHCDAMRVERLQRAEETAAKAPLKMLFPAALFIFPATLMVTIGPGLLQLFAFFGERN
jgi:tight adherence protein C